MARQEDVGPDGVVTSESSPLRIAEVEAGAGLIGITLCPGKVDPLARTGKMARDLETDVRAIADWGARAVVTLLEDAEMVRLHVATLGRVVEGFGMEWMHLPIRDHAIPDEAFAQQWHLAGPHLEAILSDGGRILVHCRGGLGRSGTVAALMLVDMGVKAETAIRRVRLARPEAIENDGQEAFIRAQERRAL